MDEEKKIDEQVNEEPINQNTENETPAKADEVISTPLWEEEVQKSPTATDKPDTAENTQPKESASDNVPTGGTVSSDGVYHYAYEPGKRPTESAYQNYRGGYAQKEESRNADNTGYQSKYQGNSSGGNYYSNPYTTFNQQPKKKKGSAAKTVAIILLCLILAGGGAAGGIAVYKAIDRNTPVSSDVESKKETEEDTTANTEKSKKTENNTSESKKTETEQKQSGQNNLTETDEKDGDILTVKEIAKENADSVVEINTQYTAQYFYMQTQQTAAGSGVILTEDGYVVTNNHVIEDAEQIHVRLHNGDWYEATLVGSDSDSDIAVLKIDAEGLRPATVGDSSTVEVGDSCVAIGNPLGTLGGTVTDGIISALDRDIEIDGETMCLMQHTAAVSPGNSGGALFDMKGNLVGIVNAKSVSSGAEGIGFAIPVNSVKTIINDLINDGYVHGKFTLGCVLRTISDRQTAQYYGFSEAGVYVYQVEKDSNADKGGLQSGDLIRSVNGQQITELNQVKELLEGCTAGDVLTFVISRKGTDMTLEVTLNEKIPNGVNA